MQNDETDAEVSIGTEIPDHEPIDEIQTEESQPSSYPCVQEDPSSSSVKLHIDDNNHGKIHCLILLLSYVEISLFKVY